MSAAPTLQRPDERLRAGDTIGDKLVVRREIGRGASATVYEAEHCEVGMPVAVKVVHGGVREPHHMARFRREARIGGRVRSPHVPQIHDVGKLHDGSPYLVMEALYGETLESYVARGPMPLGMLMELGQQLLRALEAVHRQNAIHRDVKPENLLVTEDDSGGLMLKLVDFGISKSLDEPQSLTMDGMVLGTPHYMAPEQVRGLELDERVDVYAAGAVLYEMITGRTPYRGTHADDVMAAVGREPIIPPMVMRHECPRELDELVMRALSVDADDRPASAHDMRVELERIADRWERDSQPTPLVVGASAGAALPEEDSQDVWEIAGVDDGEDRETGMSPFAGTTTREMVRRHRRRAAARGLGAGLATVGLLTGLAAAALLWDGPGAAGEGEDGTTLATAGAASSDEDEAARAARVAPSEAAAVFEPSAGSLGIGLDGEDLLAASAAKPGEYDGEAPVDDGAATGSAEAEQAGETDPTPDQVGTAAEQRRERRARRQRMAPRTTVLDARRGSHEPTRETSVDDAPTAGALDADDPEELQRRIRERVRQAMLRDPWAEESLGFGSRGGGSSATAGEDVVRDNPYGGVPENPYGAADTETDR